MKPTLPSPATTVQLLPLPEWEPKDPLRQLTEQDISDLAWDLVLFNDMDRTKIMGSYALAPETIERLKELPLFTTETANAKKAMAADPHLGIRRLAKAHLSHRVNTLNAMATSEMVEPAARLKAIDMLTRIAGLDKHTEEKKGGGVAVQINFGGALGGALATAAQEARVYLGDN